jgi:hypothetical protein
MSNRIDFFQYAQTKLTLPAATVSVFLDGVLCPDLEVLEVVRNGWPEFSWARLAYNPAAHQGANWMPAEQIQNEFAMGKSISIRQIYNGIPPGAAVFSLPIFEGHIEGIETRLDSDGEIVEIIAKDFSAVLSRITVYGQRVIAHDDSALFLTGLDTIFNMDGKPNASKSPAKVNSKSYTVFCAEPSKSRFFCLAEVIDYLLCENLPAVCLQTPNIEQLKALTENQGVRNLDVTRLNLLEALQRCCYRTGLQFNFVPRFTEVGPRQAIVFYKRDSGRVVELNCQQIGERISISKTNIAALSSRKNFWPITHRYIGQGDYKVYEATFELVKAWDPADESTDYEKFSPSTNSDFYKVKDVYRKWCLNEAGDYSSDPFNQGQPFDFTKIFQSNNFACRRRRFWPCLSNDKSGKSLGYFLQVSYDGINWWQYLYAFNNLLDECGIWLSSDRLDVNTWIAALKGVLRFRITASVIGDERLSCEVADGPVSSVASVVENVITLPRQFKYRKVSSRSIFANDVSLGVPDEIDDSLALHEFVRHKALVSSEIIETMEAKTPILAFDYRIGDIVSTNPDGRDLLGCRGDNRSTFTIKRVQMDFQRQCTNLKIVRSRNIYSRTN